MQFTGMAKSDFRSMFWTAWAPVSAPNAIEVKEPGEEFASSSRELETSTHLFSTCPLTQQIWELASRWIGCSALKPENWPASFTTSSLWREIINSTEEKHKKGIKSILLLITWEIWLERNGCIFRRKINPAKDIVGAIRRTLDQWRLAGAKCFASLFWDPP